MNQMATRNLKANLSINDRKMKKLAKVGLKIALITIQANWHKIEEWN